MHVVYSTTGTDLKEWAALASVRTPFIFERLVKRSSNIGAKSARAVAPIYNKARWATTPWRHYRHHKRVPGGLRRSLKAHKTRVIPQTRQTKHIGGFGSRKRYASYINDGFIHTKAKRKIIGRRFMEVGEIKAKAYIDTRVPLALAHILKP